MRKIIFPVIFVLGLGIFLYPIVSNFFATTAYQSVIEEQNEIIAELDEETIEKEKEKLEKHNDELADSDLNFVDPFAKNNPETSGGNTSYYDALNLSPAIGSVEIPAINVEIPIYHGTSDDVLSRGAGHLENSSLPSSKLGTHSVITAHRGLPSSKLFRNLDQVQIGDMFFTQVLDETIAYEIDHIETVLPSETDWINMEEDKNKMTLLTCEPYMINSHRMLVTGHQVPYDPKLATEPMKKDYTFYYIIGGIVVLLIIIYLIRRKKKRGEVT